MNNKLYTILSQFDKIEINRLRKYVLSPYFNPNEKLVILFDKLAEHIFSKKSEDSLEKEALWKKLFPKEAYDDVRFRKYNSDLLKLVEGYLSQQVYDNRPMQQAAFLIEAVGDKKLEKLYNGVMRSARRLAEQEPYREADFYYNQYLVERNYYDLSDAEMKRAEVSNVEDIVNNLDRFYLAEKLKYYCSILMRQVAISHDYKVLFIDEIIEHLNKVAYRDTPIIDIQYKIFKTLNEPENEAHFFELKETLAQNQTILSKEENYNLNRYALNYCIRYINMGNQIFLEEFQNLIEILLKKEVLIIDNELSPWIFKNAVLISLRLGKYDWTEQFIKDYQDKLPDDFKENAVTFNLAQVYFYQKKYQKVIELLNTVEYEDFTYTLNSRALLIGTYYEMDEYNALDSLLESFKVFLNRHKDIPASRRESFMNLIKYVKKLINISPSDREEVQKLKDELAQATNVASLKWLRDKVADLE